MSVMVKIFESTYLYRKYIFNFIGYNKINKTRYSLITLIYFIGGWREFGQYECRLTF